MKLTNYTIILLSFLFIQGCNNSNQSSDQEIINENQEGELPRKGAQNSEEMSQFAGTWTGPDFHPIIDIKIDEQGMYTIREVFGLDTAKGVMYQAKYDNGQIVAIGNEKDFYKWTLPTFKFLEEQRSKLEFNSGVGPIELTRTNNEMPNITYSPPRNND
jgi:hypothetical protein